MAITLDATQKATPITSGTTVTWNHTCASGAVLVVCTSNSDNRDVTGVTYNSDPMTEVVDESDPTGANQRCSIYMLHNPDTGGSYQVQVTFGAAIGNVATGFSASYTGVDNASVAAMHRTAYSDHGSDIDEPTVTVTDSQSGDQVIAVVQCNKTTAQPNHNELQVEENYGGTGVTMGLQDFSATGASTVMSWDVTPATTAYYNVSAVALIPGGGDVTLGLSGNAATVGRGTQTPGIEVPL